MKSVSIFVAMVVAVALSTPTQAVTVYVDAVYGNDVWSGRLAAPSGSPSTDGPWQSLTKVSSQTFQPGDVILLKCGQTWNETLKVASNGTAANPISVGSYPNGCAAKPLIDGAIPIPSRSWTARPGNIYLALLPVDLLVNTALSDGASGWGVSAPNRDATLITTNDCGSGGSPPCLTAIGGTVGNTIIYSLFEHRVSLSPSSTYTLRFRAKAAVGVNARVMVRRAGPPWDIVGLNQPVIGTGSWATYSFEFSAATSLQNARVDIELPGGRPAISVDDVRLTLRNDLLLGLFAEGTKLVQAHHPNVGHNQNSANSVYLHTASDSLAGAGGGSSYLTMGSDVATQVQSAITPGQTIRIRSRPWVIDERLVTSVAGGVINFDQPTSFPLVAGSGYYLTGALWMLDEPGEWHYNGANGALYVRMPDNQAPGSRLSFASLVAGIDLAGRSNVVVDGIATRRVGIGVSMRGSSNVTLRNSTVSDTTREGIDISSAIQGRIELNTIERTGRDAIARLGGDATTGMLVINNTVAQSGVAILPSGQPSLPMPSFAAIHAGPLSTVSGNVIRQTSYHGIAANRSTQVRDNVIQSTCMLLDDCGGIYMSGASNNSIVEGNIVLDIAGNPYGKPEEGTHVVGIYLDELTSGATVSGNTVAATDHGIQLHDSFNNQILNNTLYGNRKYQLWLQEGSRNLNPAGDVYANIVRGNLLFPTNGNPGMSQDTQFSTTANFASFDQNGYSALNSANVVREKSAATETLYRFPAWQTAATGSIPRQLDPNGMEVAQVGYTSFEVAGSNLLSNGDLSAGTFGWGSWDSTAPVPQMIVESAGGKRWVKAIPGGLYSLFFPGNFSSIQGQWYRLSFDLKTRLPNQKVVIAPRRGGGGTNGYELVTDVTRYVLGQPTWKRYTLTFQATKTVNKQDQATGDAGARIDFQQVRTGEEIYLAKVELIPMRPVGTSLRTAVLSNTSKSNFSVECPTAATYPVACGNFVRFTDGQRIVWPYVLAPLQSEIVYTRDESLVDADSDGIADLQDACPGTLPGEATNAAGCALVQ